MNKKKVEKKQINRKHLLLSIHKQDNKIKKKEYFVLRTFSGKRLMTAIFINDDAIDQNK